jgi:hypothetical protein
MSSLAIAGIVFGCVFGGALLAMLVGRALPGQHLSAESKDVMKLGLALVATLSALVLGLLIAAAKGTYDTQSSAVKQMSTNVMLLDRLLARYGPQTKEARELLRRVTALGLDSLWPEGSARTANLAPGAARAETEAFYEKIAELSPKNDAQRAIQTRARDVATELEQTRLRLFAQKDSSIPLPFLVVLVFWLVILFAGYGLLAPRNATVVVVLIVCALSIAGALFLILELDRPFEGLMQVSSAPVREALARLGE